MEKSTDSNLKDWEEQTGDVWLPEKGDVVVGAVIEIEKGEYGNQYRILDKDNQMVLTPSHKMLQNLMAKVQKGDVVRIEAGAKKPTNKGNPMQVYRVWIKKGGQ